MEPEQKTNGALIGSIIIVVILILGGLYLWRVNIKSALETNLGDANSPENLETELENIDLESIDAEI